MIPIIKKNEPNALIEYRVYPGAEYDGSNFTSIKQEIRDSLVKEQGYLCAYCMQRIEPNERQMRVEHWLCQANYPDKQLDYTNMLGCCCGNEIKSVNENQEMNAQHCDTAKGSQDLLFNPSDALQHNRLKIRYQGDGLVFSSDAEFDEQLNMILNLNSEKHRLIENRKSVWKSVTAALSVIKGSASRQQIQQFMTKWQRKNAKGELPAYCGVAIYYLKKKLQRVA